MIIILLTLFVSCATATSVFLLYGIAQSAAAASYSGIHEYKVIKDIEWAKPGGHSLTMDIYVPETGKSGYPVVVIYHGGAWLINNKSVMDSMATYIASHSEYIVCNVNYRLLGDNSNTVTMNQIVEDAFGAVLWIKEYIASYKAVCIET